MKYTEPLIRDLWVWAKVCFPYGTICVPAELNFYEVLRTNLLPSDWLATCPEVQTRAFLERKDSMEGFNPSKVKIACSARFGSWLFTDAYFQFAVPGVNRIKWETQHVAIHSSLFANREFQLYAVKRQVASVFVFEDNMSGYQSWVTDFEHAV